MKYLETKRKKSLFVLVCTLVLLFSTLNVATAAVLEEDETLTKKENIDPAENENSKLNEQLMDYGIEAVHNPIKIDNDTDFDNQAANEGWPGHGDEGDPYIISDYQIDAEGSENCVKIANTTVYFELEGNHLYNSSVNGVHLQNVTNGSILNNTVEDNGDYGINLDQSPDNTLKNNTAVKNGLHGIYLYDSENNSIIDNYASNNTYGLGLEVSNENTIYNNTLKNSSMYGIEVDTSNNNTLENNTLKMNDNHGIRLFESTRNTLINNTMEDSGLNIWGGSLDYWNTHSIDTSNSVNGQPVYYWKNRTTGTIPAGAGQVILANSTDITVEGQDVSNGSTGVTLAFSDNNTVSNNNASNNYQGIRLIESDNNTVENNIGLNNAPSGGIWVEKSENNLFKDNVLKNKKNSGWYGIMVRESSHGNTLDGNTMISNGDLGVSVSYSNDNLLINNTVKKNMWGIQHEGASQNTIRNNDAVNNSNGGIHILGGSQNKIENNQVTRNMWGISSYIGGNHHIANNTLWNNSQYNFNLFMSDNNVITNNSADESPTSLRVYYSSGNMLEFNTMMDNGYGISLSSASSNFVENNTFIGNNYGIDLSGSNNMIKNNMLENNEMHGIQISTSSSNTLVGNEMIGNGIFIEGSSEGHWNTHTIDTSNTVNGKPVYYWADEVGGTIPSDAGQVILANTTDVTVENQDFADGSVGVLLGFSDENTIENNTASNNMYGAYLYNSDRNILTTNTLSDNDNGVYITESADNLIYRNRFIENQYQAYDDGDNEWDNGDPANGGDGGNYWSDYTGTDRGDGIGDKEYNITGDGNQDNYPWVNNHMVSWADSFVVTVNDISDDTNPVIEISEAYNMHDEQLNGVYTVEIIIDGHDVTENITFTDGYAEYTWPEMMDDGEYSAEVTIDGITEFNGFYVDTTVPDVRSVSPVDGSQFSRESVSISWSGSDAISGIGYYEIRLDEGEWINVGTAQTYTFTGLSEGTHEVDIRGYDQVGHTAMDNITFEVVLEDYLTENEVQALIDGALQDYLTEQDIQDMIDNNLSTSLAAYLTEDEINSLVNESLNDELQNYTTNSDVRSEMQDMLTEYLKEEDLDNYMTEDEAEAMQSSQDDDISMSRNIGIVGIILALIAILIAAWAVMKSCSEGEETYDEEKYSEPKEQEESEIDEPFDEESSDLEEE